MLRDVGLDQKRTRAVWKHDTRSLQLKSLWNLEERGVALDAQRGPAHIVPERLGGVYDTIDDCGALFLKETTIPIIVNKWDFI